jgi:hypothetical protein
MISPLVTRKINQPRRSPAFDPQRELLYKMEREFIGQALHHTVPTKELRATLKHACSYYGVPLPKFKVVNADERTFGWTSYTTIVLNRGYHGANTVTLLHELAHWIVDHKVHDRVEAHRPQFVGVYMHLLDKYRVLPSAGFRSLAKKWGIRIGRKYLPEHLKNGSV